MGDRGSLKNLWKSFRIFLKQQKKKKEKEEKIIRTKRITKIKNNAKLGFFISLTAFFHLFYYLIPKREEKRITKLDIKVENLKIYNKFEKVKENVTKAKNIGELEVCRKDLVDIHKKVEKKDKKMKKAITTEINHVDELIEKKNPIKKDPVVDISPIVIPVVAIAENVITKEPVKKQEIDKQKLNKTKSELSNSIRYINKQLELQNVRLTKKPSKMHFIKKTIKDTVGASVITSVLFANPVIVLFTNAIIINNNIRSMRKSMNKDVKYLNVDDLDNINIKKRELERYADRVFSNSLFQLESFRKELISKYGKSEQLAPVLLEIDTLKAEIHSQQESIKTKTNNMTKRLK